MKIKICDVCGARINGWNIFQDKIQMVESRPLGMTVKSDLCVTCSNELRRLLEERRKVFRDDDNAVSKVPKIPSIRF